MPKLLIIEACLINYGDDRGGVDHAAGDFVDAPKDTANKLVTAGRALYTVKTDDPDKHGRHTVSKDMLKAAEDLAKTRAVSEKSAAEKAPA